ncbi:hypothetical protein NUW54_g5297 [Trametes sanguinea]|uniref:Uncharacterized protein n=1 Tax=Trametes sanguinea TaxID=158606 RepID=A0ACC1PXK5_9APHY|nr:hypothetical protein NUW54_g5297 [Trametes sanguinea]
MYNGLGGDPARVINAAFALNTIGQLALLILLATFFLSQIVVCRCSSVLFNLLLLSLVGSVSQYFLMYAGEIYNPFPPLGLCASQAALVESLRFASAVVALCLVVEYMVDFQIISLAAVQARYLRRVLVALPYVTFLPFSLGVATFGAARPEHVRHMPNDLACTLHNHTLITATRIVIATLVTMTVSLMSTSTLSCRCLPIQSLISLPVATAFAIIHTLTTTRNRLARKCLTIPSFSEAARIVAFALLQALLLMYMHITCRDIRTPYVLSTWFFKLLSTNAGAAPLITAFIFGSRTECYQAWKGAAVGLSNIFLRWACHQSTARDVQREMCINVDKSGGLLTGQDPTKVNTNDPLRLWIVQLGVIILMTQLLSLVLRKMRQPRVISEVLGGIILGPTAFGRIPGFTKHIFPTDSRPYLNLVANIGLCLFLFLVGMEIDAMRIKRHARYALTVAAAGVCIPFGIGTAISVPIYHTFIDKSVNFTHYMLFNGVSYSITAFPVLCRILTELKLLDTTVGIVVLSAGVGTDLIGWTLLALVVALVNAGSGLTALWTLLICIGWALLLIFIVKYPLLWLARRTGSTRDGPSMLFITFTMLLLFGSAFFTDIIGVHAIFGAFLVGIIVPREGGLTIALTEKLEDMVTIIFLPLYFALSGLSTDLGLLNTGKIWGFTIAIAALEVRV